MLFRLIDPLFQASPMASQLRKIESNGLNKADLIRAIFILNIKATTKRIKKYLTEKIKRAEFIFYRKHLIKAERF